jgi:effector-binding domain-containing protein
MQHAGSVGAYPSGPPFVAYHNMDMQDLDLEIGFPFAQEVPGGGEVVQGLIPGGKAASCLHVGPYDQIGGAYEALQSWAEANGHTLAGVAYEFYLNDPRGTAPTELQTQVLFPLA